MVAPIFADSPVEIELPERIRRLRGGLHEATLRLLELAQMAGQQIRESDFGGLSQQDNAAYPWGNIQHPQLPVAAGRGDAAC